MIKATNVVKQYGNLKALDNFSIEQLKAAISLIKNQAYIEASGGVTLDILPRIKDLGLDFISTGAPIHQSQWVDIGLDWE